MRYCEMAPVCEECGAAAEYCDSVPDASVPGYHPSECGYRHKPLCWLCAVERRKVATSRVEQVLVCPDGVARLDRDRAGGDCLCPACGKTYHRHPRLPGMTFLTLLCDGSLVKL